MKTHNRGDFIMEALKNFRKTLDSIPWVIELLLVIFFDGLYGGIYRMTRGDTTGVVIGIVWLVLAYVPMVFGWIGSIVLAVLTIVDIICVCIHKKITVLA
jgi:hypothetical protein